MRIQISDHFTYHKLVRFTAPSIFMMIFTSIYSVVDGFFVSNFAGKTPFAAVNFIMPFLMIVSTVGMMFGTGGTAIVAKAFGEKNAKRANRMFSLFTYTTFIIGAIFAIIGIVFIRPIASHLGASGQMLENCVVYARIVLAALPFFVLQMFFQSFFVTAEKPNLSLLVTVISGVTNMIYAIFGSGFFTALNDGVTSAIISFLRTMVFEVAAVLLLPAIWGITGIWLSIIVAEFMAMFLSGAFLIVKQKKYHY